MKKLLLAFKLLSFIILFGGSVRAQDVLVIFRVDMSQAGLGPSDFVTLNGSFNNWCGDCDPMHHIGNSVYELQRMCPASDTFDYKFSIGNFADIEEFLPGDPCTITTGNFTNRRLITGTSNMTLATVCYNACVSCAEAPIRSFATFVVNMSDYVGDLSAGLHVIGSFNSWCPECAPMDSLGGGMYSREVLLPAGNYQYKFMIGLYTDPVDSVEAFVSGDPCTVDDGDFTNRKLIVSSSDRMLVGPYCWNTCNICDPTAIKKLDSDHAFKTYPNPVVDELIFENNSGLAIQSLSIFAVTGKKICSLKASSGNSQKILTDHLPAGVYFLKIDTSSDSVVRRFTKL